MSHNDLLSLLSQTGAWCKGHFLLSSGRHSDQYIQCARLFENPLHGEIFGTALAREFQNCVVDVVVGPALGGILLAYDVGRSLGKRVLFAERADGKMSFRRGFCIKPGEKVLVVEDVVTTGGSVQEVAELVRQSGGNVVGIGSIVLRRSPGVDLDFSVKTLLEFEVPSYAPDSCPLCSQGIPITKPG
ncbi:MAG TPA: orotate phosphoribosyltransferase, partial [bacterium]|nr:orotate phosphoribosyltransferase [bacterium]